MSAHRITFVLGGARSGKSRFALASASSSKWPKVFVATGEARDREMAVRIDRHQRERGAEWKTIEEPIDVARVIRESRDELLLIDCLTLWIANQMNDRADAVVDPAIDDLVEALSLRRSTAVVVSNEVGSGIVPENALARAFRDTVGHANQAVASVADDVFLLVAGQPVRVKGGS